MTWVNPISDLRTILNDNSNDCLRSRKKVFGTVDGTNLTFKTFEFRRITNFHDVLSSIVPLGVYVNGVAVPVANIASDDIETGTFVFATGHAPTPATGLQGTVVQATYYIQQFLDTELTSFLSRATQSLQLGNNMFLVDPQLQDAVLNYAASEALKKLAMKYTMRASDTFLLEDSPKKEALEISDSYNRLAATYLKNAFQIRDAYYTRAGQTLAPNFVNNFGRVGAVTPRR